MIDTATTPASTQTATATPSSVTTTSTVKPAYRTSEAYINLAAGILGAAVSAGFIGSGSQINVVGGMLLTFFAAAIHTWSRTSIKNAAVAP
jgi:hypothetical protein